jgi:hypothetical protein
MPAIARIAEAEPEPEAHQRTDARRAFASFGMSDVSALETDGRG